MRGGDDADTDEDGSQTTETEDSSEIDEQTSAEGEEACDQELDPDC